MKLLTLIISFSFLLSFLLLSFIATAATIDPDTILKKADDIRNPNESFFMKVQVKSTGESEDSEFEVYIKGKEKTLFKTILPRRERGKNYLMLEENIWVFLPNLKREVRVSLSQKLTGQAANGDIGRMRWHGDYTAKLVKEDDETYQLDLVATKKGLTYDKITAWINKKNFRPVKADYLTVTGKILKHASFGGYKQIAGNVRPTQITIADAVNTSDSSLITIVIMESKEFPDSMFSRENLQ
ncbi:MAG: outer membrane lipoprotein-sorting protein [Oligoflexia bacterium]|nr:outer membrane lipoprotein-sorting protein [Oligoflexia bacterium]